MLYCCTELKILFNIGRKLDVCHSYVRVLFMYLAWPPVVNFETSRSTTILKPLNICCYSGVFYCWLLGNQGKVRKCRDYFSKRKIFCSQAALFLVLDVYLCTFRFLCSFVSYTSVLWSCSIVRVWVVMSTHRRKFSFCLCTRRSRSTCVHLIYMSEPDW